MSDKSFSIALPYAGQRYYLTMPDSGYGTRVDYKLWGAGGAAGAIDTYAGSAGAGGNYVTGTTTVTRGSTIQVFVGQGGQLGYKSSGCGAGPGGASYSAFAGGRGGNAGSSGYSGGGGGGGGATVLLVNSQVYAVAGGGGGGAGGGDKGGANPATAGILPKAGSHGGAGGDRSGDGGGGGGGGGGYSGGAGGGTASRGDVGGYPGYNGSSYILGLGTNIGGNGAYTMPGGTMDPNYPAGAGYGGPYFQAGHNGYAILTFYYESTISVNVQGTYKSAVPYVKIDGTWRKNNSVWTKVNGEWKSVQGSTPLSFSTDSTNWGT